jgi:hypothetical protein
MVCFQTKISILGKFWAALKWKMLIYFRVIWNIFGHLVYIMAIWYILCSLWYIFSDFGITYQEKSGNPVRKWHSEFEKYIHSCEVSVTPYF